MTKPSRVTLGLCSLLLALLLTGCPAAQPPIGEITAPAVEQECEVESGGELTVTFVRIQNVRPDAELSWSVVNGGTFDDASRNETIYNAPETEAELTVTIGLEIRQNGQSYSARSLTCTVRAAGAPTGEVGVATARPADPTATPEPGTPVPEATATTVAATPTPARPVVEITVVYPSGATWVDRGIGMQNAATMAAKDLLAGRLKYLADELLATYGVELRVGLRNDMANESEAREIAEELVQPASLTRCVVGHFNSDSSIAAGDIYSQIAMPMLTPASTRASVTQEGRDSVWRLVATDEFQAPEAYRLAAAALKERNALLGVDGQLVIVHRDGKDDFVQGVIDEFRLAAAAAGEAESVLADAALYTRQSDRDPDFTQTIANISGRSPAVGAILFLGTAQELNVFLGQYPDFDKRTPIIGVSAMDNINIVRGLRQNQYLVSYTGLAVPVEQPANVGAPLMAEWFIEDYDPQGRLGLPPANAAETYDGILICAEAIKQALQDRGSVQALQPADVNAALKKLVLGGAQFAIAFNRDDRGTAAGPYIFVSGSRELRSSVLMVHTAAGTQRLSCGVDQDPPCR